MKESILAKCRKTADELGLSGKLRVRFFEYLYPDQIYDKFKFRKFYNHVRKNVECETEMRNFLLYRQGPTPTKISKLQVAIQGMYPTQIYDLAYVTMVCADYSIN